MILFTPIIVKIFRSAARGALGRFNLELSSRIQAVGAWFIWIFMIILAISQLYLEITALLVVVALLGLALILAARDLLPNLLMEQLLTTEMLFKRGDWIQVGKHYGRVVKIDPLNTVIVTPSNEQVVIPNSTFSRETIVNLTSTKGVRVTIPITVDRRNDLSKVEKALLKVCNELKSELVGDRKPEIQVSKLSSDTVDLNVHLWILNPGKRDYVVSEVLRRAKKLFT
jgi:small conductance mechanosensitive channel